jgi:hypothetical protein
MGYGENGVIDIILRALYDNDDCTVNTTDIPL